MAPLDSAMAADGYSSVTTLAELAAMMLGLQPGASASRSDAALKANASARVNIGRIRLMMTRLGVRDVGDLFRPNGKGGYDVAEWIDGGRLPSGGMDPAYALQADTTRKNHYSTLVMIADAEKSCAAFARTVPDAARDHFRAKLHELSENVRASVRRNELSDRELRSILPWSCIEAKYAQHRDELDADDRLLVDYWLMDPMEFPPKRLDVGDCLLVRSRAAAARVSEKQDYLLLLPPPKKRRSASASAKGAAGSGGRQRRSVKPAPAPAPVPEAARWTAELHLRSYKTAKHYDEFVQELPPALAEAVAANVEAEAAGGAWRKYLFQSKTGRARPLTDNTFGRRVTAAFQRLTGVPIGASNLRKAFVSHLLNTPDLSQEQLGLVARRMMHSENTQRDYRRVDIRLSLQRLVDADGGAPAPDDPRCDPAGAA
jgi:hypothetical protein